MKVFGLLTAAGSSVRYGKDKLRERLRGREVWQWSWSALASHPEVHSAGIVCREAEIDFFRAAAPDALFVVAGGDTRQQSVHNGLRAIPPGFDAVLVHDAARPGATEDLISRVIAGVRELGAALPGLSMVDTIKERTPEGLRTLDRSKLVAVQTPQGARLDLMLRAYEQANEIATDDAALLEAIGVHPMIVEGDRANVKVTTPWDLEQLAGPAETEVRSGLGYDVHKFSDDPNRPCVLGGVTFEGAPGLEGHSDADVLLHAIVDALLGALSLGDIGKHYPNTDPRWKDQPSTRFLKDAGEMVRENGWEIVNIDTSVIAELPKVMNRSPEVCRHVAEALRIEEDRVSLKATTNEKLGAIGRGEGIAAFAIATVRRSRRS